MASIGSYSTTAFSEDKKFLVLDPATQSAALVSGADLVGYITPSLTQVFTETTRAAALTTDYQIGQFVQTAGAAAINDGGNGLYIVVAGGDGDYAMMNGNDLLLLPFGSLAGSNLDGALVTDDGTQIVIEDAIALRPVQYGSMEAVRLSTTSHDYIETTSFYASGTTGAAKLYRDGTGTPTGSGAAVIAAALAAGTFCNAAGHCYKLRTDKTVDPFQFGAKGDGTDDYEFLNSFNLFFSANRCLSVDYSGNFSISAKVYVGPSAGTIATAVIKGRAKWTALNAIDEMVEFRNCYGLHWEGFPEVVGTGDADYADRTCRVGIVIGGASTASRLTFSGIRANFLKQTGISCRTLTTLSDLGDVQTLDCGSGTSTAGASLTANWNTKVDSGSSGSGSQRSTITVDQLPPTTVDTPIMVLISGKMYYVYTVDTGASTIAIFPWIDTGLSSGTLRYVFGAGLYMFGADAGIIGAASVDARRCGVGVWSDGLYGPVINRLVAQTCGVGIAVGGDPADGHVGLQLNGFYTETVDFSVMRVTRALTPSVGGFIACDYETDISKVGECCTARLTSNALNYSVANLSTIAWVKGGIYHHAVKAPNNIIGSTLSLNIFRNVQRQIYKANSWTINLAAPPAGYNLAFGYDSGMITVFGTGASLEPTGTITFNPPATYTVNGGASAAFSGATAPADFSIYLDVAALNFIVWRK